MSSGSIDRRASRRGLDQAELVCACLVVAGLSFNGDPFRLSSGVICIFVIVVLTVHGLLRRGGSFSLAKSAVAPALVLGAWTAVATVSAAANLSGEALKNLVCSYWIPFILFMLLATLKPSERDLRTIVLWLAIGLLVRFSMASLVFYRDWGIPDLRTIFDVHFNVDRIEPYQDVTYGNTGSTAALIAETTPVLVVVLMIGKMRWFFQALIGAAVVVLGANLVITGSRGAILVIAFAVAVASFQLRSPWRYLIVVAIPIAYLLLAASSGQDFSHRLFAALSLDAQGDKSVGDRMDSITYGWKLMFDHPFGVGPGMEHWYNPYGATHQFAVGQGAELGPAGLGCALLLVAFVLWSAATTVPPAERRYAFAFVAGGVSWVVYAMTTNTPLSSGLNMPWITFLALSLAFGAAGSNVNRWSPAARARRPRVPRQRLLGVRAAPRQTL